MRWVIEDVFGSGFSLRYAAQSEGHTVTEWCDGWWDGSWPRWPDEPVVFHGSLGNAAKIRTETDWLPGSFCDVEALKCSSWYPRAQRWLLNREWHALSASELVTHPPYDRMFVRPDSPLKPFSGRVIERRNLTLASLDFGYYFEDPSLPVLVSPVQPISDEWRFVIVEGRAITGSAYYADGRRPGVVQGSGEPWRFAQMVASDIESPEAVYVMDICRSGRALKLVEINAFSGADLYACDPLAIVRAIAKRCLD